jgi:hypothetical protein
MKNKTTPLFFILLITLVSCKTSDSKTKADQYFQGDVNFIISYEPKSPEAQEFIDNYMSTQMVGTVMENKYKISEMTKALGKVTTYYYLNESRIYYDIENSDTIKWYPLDKEPGELISVTKNEKEQKKVLGAYRESVTIKYISDSPYSERHEGTYYFHPQYKLNKELYANHKSGFWNLFVNKSGSISVFNEIYVVPLYKSTHEAIEIKEREVSEEEFILNPNKAILKGEE